jgi:hypothetical protein
MFLSAALKLHCVDFETYKNWHVFNANWPIMSGIALSILRYRISNRNCRTMGKRLPYVQVIHVRVKPDSEKGFDILIET